MPAHTPQLSVLLPVHNADLYLGDAIRSVLDQCLQNFELIILDDGSTDRSPDIARAYADADPRINAIQREHRGLVATLNELLDLARAPLCARMDADDICLPKRFRRQTRFLYNHDDTVCVGGAVIFINHIGEQLGRAAPLLADTPIQHAALQGRTPICHPAATFRTKAARAAGGYRSRAHPAADLDLWLRLGEIGKLANIPDDVLAYRQHGASLSSKHGDTLFDAAQRVCDEAAQRRKIPSQFAHPSLDTPDPVTQLGIAPETETHAPQPIAQPPHTIRHPALNSNQPDTPADQPTQQHPRRASAG